LTRALRAGRVAPAYLVTGPRGVGKTSVARILAHEINQLPYDEESQHLDIIEIDAASNTGVDDVRDLRAIYVKKFRSLLFQPLKKSTSLTKFICFQKQPLMRY